MDEFFEFEKRGKRSHYRRKPLVDNAYYHVFKRREDAANVFLDDRDRDTYRDTMRRLLAPGEFRDERGRALRPLVSDVRLFGYCLLNNHYHSILWVETAAGLTDYMHRLQTSYGQRFNNRHGRRGPVFDERYDAELITDTRMLKTAIAYVHANPGNDSIGYEWSGHRAYLDNRIARKESEWLSAGDGLEIFSGRTNYLEWFLRALESRNRKK